MSSRRELREEKEAARSRSSDRLPRLGMGESILGTGGNHNFCSEF